MAHHASSLCILHASFMHLMSQHSPHPSSVSSVGSSSRSPVPRGRPLGPPLKSAEEARAIARVVLGIIYYIGWAQADDAPLAPLRLWLRLVNQSCRHPKLPHAELLPAWAEARQAGPAATEFRADRGLNGRIRLWCGDITKLEVDAVVNAANAQLRNGGGSAAPFTTRRASSWVRSAAASGRAGPAIPS